MAEEQTENQIEESSEAKGARRVKQAIVWSLSFGVAIALSIFIVYGLLDTDIETYTWVYFVLTVLPIGFIFVIWGDLLLGANIMPD